VEDGLLTRLDLAFSRDQEQKEYVQTRMREQGPEIFRWLQGGAYIYVCGEAEQMAGDVERALLDIIATYHHVDAAGARTTSTGSSSPSAICAMCTGTSVVDGVPRRGRPGCT
jgi:sulfite reductase alpha subunit-like flavoprotein